MVLEVSIQIWQLKMVDGVLQLPYFLEHHTHTSMSLQPSAQSIPDPQPTTMPWWIQVTLHTEAVDTITYHFALSRPRPVSLLYHWEICWEAPGQEFAVALLGELTPKSLPTLHKPWEAVWALMSSHVMPSCYLVVSERGLHSQLMRRAELQKEHQHHLEQQNTS